GRHIAYVVTSPIGAGAQPQDVYLSTPMLGEMESSAGVAPASWWPCANTFADRRLNCSANGIEIESAGASFNSRLRCDLVLASLTIRYSRTKFAIMAGTD